MDVGIAPVRGDTGNTSCCSLLDGLATGQKQLQARIIKRERERKSHGLVRFEQASKRDFIFS